MEKEQAREQNPTDFLKLRCYAVDDKGRQCKNIAAFYQRKTVGGGEDVLRWLCVEHVEPESVAESTLAIK